MLLTNEVGWIHPLTHPSFEIMKKYQLMIRGNVDDEKLQLLREGQLTIPDNTETREKLPSHQKCFPRCAMSYSDREFLSSMSCLEVVVHDISATFFPDMIAALGAEFVSCKRVEFGPLKMRNLKRGEWRELTSAEIGKLKQFCKKTDSVVSNAVVTTRNTPAMSVSSKASIGQGESRRIFKKESISSTSTSSKSEKPFQKRLRTSANDDDKFPKKSFSSSKPSFSEKRAAKGNFSEKKFESKDKWQNKKR
jgi:hypothetical protein